MKRAAVAAVAATLLLTTPAWAPYHLVVIEQVFFGTESAPAAHYVMLRTLATGQIFVNGQQLTKQEADGAGAGLFGQFSRNFVEQALVPDSAILAGTQAAQDLFCVDMDEIVTGSLVYPDGRVCFGLFDFFDGQGPRPVDCVGYGDFTGDNGPYGAPASQPQLGLALVRTSETDDNQSDFDLLAPSPQNVEGAVGMIDGTPGDADGSGAVDTDDLDEIGGLAFAAQKRCAVAAARRGADANADTRISAADLIATADLIVRGS